ncbi:protein O-mannosyl-transferase Tmtc3 [Nasonia vitripennis]|uniref:dolichyl-phosphate-mannose--protein mannosyltransferase n=1 Tax=Nasonia vitripennis TaxID=7425 RepID=A0A7M7G3P3_NASVI|nr:protein O-mannosyl-transferase Tmtc3 [Nasonia vitripennis]
MGVPARGALAAVVAATAFACYLNSLGCGFVFDDISAIKDNRDLRPHTPLKNVFFNDFWGTPMHKEQSHKSYRPLCVLTFRWNYMIHQLDPMGYHLLNVILHVGVCLLYFRTCLMFLPDVASFVSALLFAVHPIHTEAVTGVVGRAETLSSLFYLAALITYTKCCRSKRSTGWRSLIMSMFFVFIAMLCKEQGITATAVCVLYEIFVVQRVRALDIVLAVKSAFDGKKISPTWSSEGTKRLTAVTLVTFSLLILRLHVMGSKLPVFTRFDNPASVASTPTRQLTYNYLAAVNLRLLFLPIDLCCDWTMGTIPLIETLLDVRNVATLAAHSTVIGLLVTAVLTRSRQTSIIIIMSLAMMILPFLPASNLFFPVGFVVAERVLYAPSMGFCMLVGYGWHILCEKSKKISVILLLSLLLAHATKTYVRNYDWLDEYQIFMSGLKVNDRNAKLFNNVGHALESQGRFKEALNFFNMAVQVQGDDIGAHINVGRTYNHLKMFKEAEDAYLKAKSLLPKAKPGESYQARIAPNHLNVFVNLANLIAKNATRLEEADLLYRQAISMRADYTLAYINRGDVLIKLNRTKEAQEVYERALFYDSNNPDIYYNLGVVFLEQGKASQALAYLDKALEFDPEHEQALLNSAILLQELGRAELRKVARERLLKLLRKDSNNERVHFNLGMLAMDDHDSESAERWFRNAVALKEDFRSALFNLALLLADEQRPLEAAPFLNQLVRFHPDHVKGLILLGDIYINNIKDLDAAENCYRRILQLDPTNIQGLHNLCVVMVERGKLGLAAQCLERAAALAPQQDYVHRHLAIVRARISRLPKEELAAAGVSEEDVERFDESLWMEQPDEEQQPQSQPLHQQQTLSGAGDSGAAVDDPTSEQFLGKPDNSVFLNHAVVHNHLGSKPQQKQGSGDTVNARRAPVNIKGPSKHQPSAQQQQPPPQQHHPDSVVDGLSSMLKQQPSATSGVFDRTISADATAELELAQKRAASARSKLEQQQMLIANRSQAAAITRSKV